MRKAATSKSSAGSARTSRQARAREGETACVSHEPATAAIATDRLQDLAHLLAVGYLRLLDRERAESAKAPPDLVAWMERGRA